MSSLSKHIRDLLVAANVGTANPAGPWPIIIGSIPDNTLDVIVLFDAPGGAPNPKWRLDYPAFMVHVRSLNYEAGYEKAQELRSALLGLPSQDVNDIRMVGIWVVVDTHFLQADTKGRKIFVSTWRTITEPTSGTHRQPL